MLKTFYKKDSVCTEGLYEQVHTRSKMDVIQGALPWA